MANRLHRYGFERNDLVTYASAISFQILTAIVPFLLGLLGFLDGLQLDAIVRGRVRRKQCAGA